MIFDGLTRSSIVVFIFIKYFFFKFYFIDWKYFSKTEKMQIIQLPTGKKKNILFLNFDYLATLKNVKLII